jgi:hypothetical protein
MIAANGDVRGYAVGSDGRGRNGQAYGRGACIGARRNGANRTLSFSFLFLFLGALPCTEWLDDTVARDHDGFILTGAAAPCQPEPSTKPPWTRTTVPAAEPVAMMLFFPG